ncbi:MAG: hypothetical protein J2P57_20875 [Acidimicrobiaceae bacterium]|nr:hypothetical protein [Acidimicrobiaceae bacterium]
MTRIPGTLARVRRRVMLVYDLAYARRQARRLGLQAPSGVWLCEHCWAVRLDLAAFDRHSRLHAR